VPEFLKFLPKFMIPTRLHVLDSLPKNPNGKIVRKSLASGFK
jgi:acyl-coenzyme A synthetase/AMP-(fatty) acid ligase